MLPMKPAAHREALRPRGRRCDRPGGQTGCNAGLDVPARRAGDRGAEDVAGHSTGRKQNGDALVGVDDAAAVVGDTEAGRLEGGALGQKRRG